ncbi:MAG: hypothetical protein HRF50_10885 [Phycisphaerae bacterium]|jgi:hypothetical protein
MASKTGLEAGPPMGGATPALHSSEQPDPDRGAAGAEFAVRRRPGLRVADLDDFHRRLVERHVPCLQPPEEVFGARVAQYADPDGPPFSVGEGRRSR